MSKPLWMRLRRMMRPLFIPFSETPATAALAGMRSLPILSTGRQACSALVTFPPTMARPPEPFWPSLTRTSRATRRSRPSLPRRVADGTTKGFTSNSVTPAAARTGAASTKAITASRMASSLVAGFVLRRPPAARVRTALRESSRATRARSAVAGEKKMLAAPSRKLEARYSAKIPPGPKETTGPKSFAKR